MEMPTVRQMIANLLRVDQVFSADKARSAKEIADHFQQTGYTRAHIQMELSNLRSNPVVQLNGRKVRVIRMNVPNHLRGTGQKKMVLKFYLTAA